MIDMGRGRADGLERPGYETRQVVDQVKSLRRLELALSKLRHDVKHRNSTYLQTFRSHFQSFYRLPRRTEDAKDLKPEQELLL